MPARIHGKRDTKIYHVWEAIIQRCTNPNHPTYHYYGGRGITVCDEWRKFVNFFSDMGEHPGDGYSIDRIDNDKGYYKENCRWATKDEQVENRRNIIKMTLPDGRVVSLKKYCREMGYNYNTVMGRKHVLGLPLEECFREEKYKHFDK